MKRTLSLVLVILSLLSIFAVSVSADDYGIQPLWDNTSTISCRVIMRNDGYGYAEAEVLGYFEVDKIKVDVYLYVQNGSNWDYVGEDHVSVEDYVAAISYQFVPDDGAYYRADYTFTVTKNGVDEVIQKSSYKQN